MMTAQEFEDRIVAWARRQPDVEALVQIGSRAQAGARVDEWSDWDYHIITARPARYRGTSWLAEIAPCWSAHYERTPRGVVKVSAVFEGGYEVDFVPISVRAMKLVYWAMARPGLRRFYPSVLRAGVANTRLIAGPGCKVVIGGEAWERRVAALAVSWPGKSFTAEDFTFHVSAFWRHAVWIFKKIARGESRAALRWNQVEAGDHLWALLIEEARLAGRPARPEARQAEQWLDSRRREQTDLTLAPNRQVLAHALLAQIDLLEEVAGVVAAARGFTEPDHSALAGWLRAELIRLKAEA